MQSHGGLDAVRLYLQKRIDRSSARIAAARKGTAGRSKRRAGRRHPETEAEVAARKAYRDALRALASASAGGPAGAGLAGNDVIRAGGSGGGPAALRMAAEEVERVKSALAKIYEVTQHANHDIADAADWGIVEGEAQTALNIVHEAERTR